MTEHLWRHAPGHAGHDYGTIEQQGFRKLLVERADGSWLVSGSLSADSLSERPDLIDGLGGTPGGHSATP